MDDFSDIMAPDTVLAGLTVPNKKALFQQLVTVAARESGLDAKLILERLTERERLGSTGFGGGIAIPHGKIDGLQRVIGVFARLSAPIDYQAIDDMPVDIIFLLLSPPDAGVEHLKALSRVSRRLRDRTFVTKLQGAGSPDALYALFTANDARDAALSDSPRLASGLIVGALIRRLEAEGGHGMVIAKGDATAGAILLVLADRGETVALLERTLGRDGYAWGDSGPADPAERGAYLERRRGNDPDLSDRELDHPDARQIAMAML